MTTSSIDSRQQWLREYYDRVDAMDVEGFLGMIAEDGRLTLGNADEVVGRDAILQAFGGPLSVLRSCRHVLHRVYDLGGDLTAVEGEMELVRQDGREVSVRFTNFLDIGADGLMREQRVTADFSPLFA